MQNSITHGLGALLAAFGLGILIPKVVGSNLQTVAAIIIYGISLLILYLMSCLYHAFTNTKTKQIFRIFDHSSIFILITGSYMPFLLVSLANYSYAIYVAVLLGICCISGIVLNIVDLKRFEKISMILYILMGWFVIFMLKDVVSSLDINGLILLILGGLAYTIGIIFYKAKKIRYMHSIWHVFVLMGSIFHYMCIYLFVI